MKTFISYLFLLIAKWFFGYEEPPKVIFPSVDNLLISNCSSFFSNPYVTIGQQCPYGFNSPYCDECGLRFQRPNAKIIGGVEAEPHSWPSMVLIKFEYKFKLAVNGKNQEVSQDFFCGGSLINRDTVLTAAHCYVKEFPYNLNQKESQIIKVVPNEFHSTYETVYTIYLGIHDITFIKNKTKLTQGIAMEIIQFRKHQNYNEDTSLNDIAIIKLKNKINPSCDIQFACLPNPVIPHYPKDLNIGVWAAGWGRRVPDGPVSEKLYNVRLGLYDPSYCSPLRKPNDWNTQFCAGWLSGGKDTCQGDSGGPIFYIDNVNGKQKFILIGITSYGPKECGSTVPGIYTRVSGYLNWIKENS